MFSQKKKRTAVKIILFIILAVVAVFFLREFISNYFVRLSMKNVDAPGKDSRVLVFAPHNDDETLAASVLMKNTIKNGGQVKVVFVTNGDGFKQAIEADYINLNPKPQDYVNFGYTRQKESINALKAIGVPENNMMFLGYPDGGISRLFNTCWDEGNPYTSEFTKVNKSPYDNSFRKGASYTGQNLEQDMCNMISEYKPTHIIYPHPNDHHPDHWGVNAFVKHALATLNYKPQKEWLYLVHRGDWPVPLKQERNMYLVPPYKLANLDTKWSAFDITDDEIAEKATNIHRYKTQIRPLGPLLTAFERKNELFGEYDDGKLARGKGNSTSIQPSSENKVITDPLQDVLSLQMAKSADIVAEYAQQSANGDLVVMGQMDGNIEEYATYGFNFIFFKNNQVSRLNLEVKDNKAHARSVSKQSIGSADKVNVTTKGKYVYIAIPESVTGDFNRVFMNSTTFIGGKMADKTAWRMVDKQAVP